MKTLQTEQTEVPTMVQTIDPKTLRKRRIQLIMLAALFFAPVISAWVAWQFMGEHGVATTTNAGQLISPARPLPVPTLQALDDLPLPEKPLQGGRWTYLHFLPGSCDQACGDQLILTRQTRIGINKDIPRVQRLLIVQDELSSEAIDELRAAHPEMLFARLDGGMQDPFLRAFREAGQPTDGSIFFVVDPLGNLMMRYSLEAEPKGLFKDLKKLLKASQIG